MAKRSKSKYIRRPAQSPQSASDRGGDSGYLLVEMIIAVAILAIAASVVLGSISSALRADRSAENISRATMLLQETASRIRTEGLPSEKKGDFEDRAPGFTWRATPAFDTCDDDGFCSVDIRVFWKERGRENSSYITAVVPVKKLPPKFKKAALQ